MNINTSTQLFSLLICLLALITGCGEDTPSPSNEIVTPATYIFERNGSSSVSFSGQTTRLAMAEEIVAAMKDNSRSAASLLAMFNHIEGTENFSSDELNASGKNVRSKTAASSDFFSTNSTDATAIKQEFDSFIQRQVDEVFSNWETLASPGVPGQIADGTSTRYVSAKGLEYDQIFGKGLIGALMTDQIVNNYISTSVLDANNNRSDNDGDILAEGKNYTTMEHKWDEAYGYLFGASANPSSPLATLGTDDGFLNKYLGRLESDTDFAGIATTIYDAFKLGRAAIVAKNYIVRDQQAEIIREKISLIIGVRAVYYLQAGKNALEANDFGGAFHDLSEGLGFVKSLQCTRKPNSIDPYFSKSESDGFVNSILGGQNGLWNVSGSTLDQISEQIANEFGFTVEQAAN